MMGLPLFNPNLEKDLAMTSTPTRPGSSPAPSKTGQPEREATGQV